MQNEKTLLILRYTILWTTFLRLTETIFIIRGFSYGQKCSRVHRGQKCLFYTLGLGLPNGRLACNIFTLYCMSTSWYVRQIKHRQYLFLYHWTDVFSLSLNWSFFVKVLISLKMRLDLHFCAKMFRIFSSICFVHRSMLLSML